MSEITVRQQLEQASQLIAAAQKAVEQKQQDPAVPEGKEDRFAMLLALACAQSSCLLALYAVR